ncbi:MAG: UDP-N-acetylmuramoyl-L-alanyl-D-glutamate--2,6-diaminopimelate ligase, partial [bacterium]|nr:UDP-N-acetylmuramoyl-L-alanyl-D-glutamate--2,6-diaminopimelate ligase [bacterium]
LLAEVRAAGAHAVAMEVSSHALALHRADDVEFDVAGFTNLSQDHLDFHASLEAYAAAKRVLFAELLVRSARQPERVKPAGHAVVNAGDATARAWLAGDASAFPATHTLTYGFLGSGDGEPPDVRAGELEMRPDGSRFRLEYAGRFALVSLSLPGRFNVSNALCAASCGLALGFEIDVVARGLGRVPVVPGRMMRVCATAREASVGPLPTVLVDYAHTPDGLANVLDAVRPATRGRLVVVFGAGGDRDRAKRPLMGAAAAERADTLYVTSDNPRSEDPQTIIDEVLSGVGAAGSRGLEVFALVDRAEAIRAAVLSAGADDVVVVAGKGHEEYQIVGSERRPFDDAAVARAALEAWGR